MLGRAPLLLRPSRFIRMYPLLLFLLPAYDTIAALDGMKYQYSDYYAFDGLIAELRRAADIRVPDAE